MQVLFRPTAVIRVEDPLVKYTHEGRIHCTACDLLIGSEQQWNAHKTTPTHKSRAQKHAEAQNRKAKRHLTENGEDKETDKEIKRVKSGNGGLPEDFFDNSMAEEKEKTPDLDAEWAAFQKDIASAAAAAAHTNTNTNTNVIIEHAPELYNQGAVSPDLREQHEQERHTNQEVLQNDLYQQFEEQKEFEERVQKLKAMREQMKKQYTDSKGDIEDAKKLHTQEEGGEEEDDDDDEDQSDDEDSFALFRKKR
ncbi:uncharacterized protein V2V93DRAFT_375614 [Kockiozyma suomiensis]|uniref:uncharacterized protein n=1 Tax=Kockiozyma suomiensis TaxID=1337062 RepID=UPI003343915A